MGMYTSITGSNVKIIDMEGLKAFLKKLGQGKYKEYHNKYAGWTDTGKNRGPNYAEAVKIEGDMLDFNGFNGWKIIGYYYWDFLQFIRDVAVFIEGDVQMEYETDDHAGWIEFTGGKAIIHHGTTQWSEIDPNEGVGAGEVNPMPEDVRKHLVARKI